jgi:hypothetical protein
MSLTLPEFHELQIAMSATTADEDATCLGAIRRANEILRKHQVTWVMVLNRVVTVESPFDDEPDDEELRELFELAMTKARGSFKDTVQRIHEFWAEHHTISTRQRQIIEAVAKRP